MGLQGLQREAPTILQRRALYPQQGEADVWQLDLSGDVFTAQANILTGEEMLRCRKFAFDRDRNRFLRAKCYVRIILGKYLGVAPCDVPINIGEHGKPFLAPDCGLAFNLSHSHDLGVLAIRCAASSADTIGIDIEVNREPAEIRALARTVFSPAEFEEFSAMHYSSLSIPFFTCWTRKEAYLKAIGAGFTIEPSTVTVGLAPQRLAHAHALASGGFVDVLTIRQSEESVLSLAVAGGCTNVRTMDADSAINLATRGIH